MGGVAMKARRAAAGLANAWPAAALGVCLMSGAGGCAGPGGSTRLRVDDFEATTAAIAADLRSASFLAGRDAASEPWTVSIDKAVNLSSDVISESERWYIVQRVRSGLPMLSLSRERNIAFVIPAETWRRVMGDDPGEVPQDPGRAPTHQMRAEFRSITRTAGLDRTDAYVVFYAITDLRTGTEVWNGEYTFKRAARGRAWD
ncbi:MAG: hypothetical protein IT439_07550 [Phycisphaerales bacterium]|nr:hypothetical protein [Phycisphaerales bacterium]